jgi:hypothetical protein
MSIVNRYSEKNRKDTMANANITQDDFSGSNDLETQTGKTNGIYYIHTLCYIVYNTIYI